MKHHSLDDVLTSPIVVAPMAGGPSTPELVVAAARAGALGFLAGGYKSPQALRAEIDTVRSLTSEAFGVNIFVPGKATSKSEELERYLLSLDGDARALGTDLGVATWHDDYWSEKVSLLARIGPPIVSFTFGCPEPDLVDAFHDVGSVVAVTVTSAKEAVLASSAGADCLCVQGVEAGAHRGSFGNGDEGHSELSLTDLLNHVGSVSALPLIAAGAVMSGRDVRTMISRGARAVQCGTAFLRSPESGANSVHKDALASDRFNTTALTRAFSGRPARALVNTFVKQHGDAPAAYPEINDATRPLRSAATLQGDLERMSLWAGTGFREARALPVEEIVTALLDGTSGVESHR